MPYKLCPDCDCPMKPKNVEKKVNEYDHAFGCPRGIRVQAHVRVIKTKPDGVTPHPHAGKTGRITELMGVLLTGPGWAPRAQVRIDPGQPEAGNIMIVSLQCLEVLEDETHAGTVGARHRRAVPVRGRK